MKKLDEWMSHCSKSEQFVYHSQVINELVPITRWYKESIRNGNGIAIEGVWMLFTSTVCRSWKKLTIRMKHLLKLLTL